MRKLLRPGPIMVLLLGLAWIIFVIVEIANDPPDGENSLEILRSRTAEAIHDDDPDALQRLFTDTTAGESYAAGFLAHLDPQLRVSATVETRGSNIRITTPAGVCTQWTTVQDGDRFLLDAEPVLSRC